MRTPDPSRSGSRERRSIPQRNEARVFPEPVGAQISVCAPEAIAGQPRSLGGRGGLERCLKPLADWLGEELQG